MQLSELAKNVSIKVSGDAKLSWDKRDDWQKSSHGYSVTLTYDKRRMKLDFFMGSGHGDTQPTSYDVLSCLLSDASTAENTQNFEEWASELGMDTDSRSALKTYKATLKQTVKLNVLLGGDYETFLTAEQD